MQCPRCGADDSAEILYGLPAMTPEMQAKLGRIDIMIGGCCLTGTEAKFFCRSCHFKFGSPPRVISKLGAEKYMDIVTSVRFSVGSYFYGYPEILIKKTLSGITLDVRAGFTDPSRSLQRAFSLSDWKALLNTLYCKLHLHE